MLYACVQPHPRHALPRVMVLWQTQLSSSGLTGLALPMHSSVYLTAQLGTFWPSLPPVGNEEKWAHAAVTTHTVSQCAKWDHVLGFFVTCQAPFVSVAGLRSAFSSHARCIAPLFLQMLGGQHARALFHVDANVTPSLQLAACQLQHRSLSKGALVSPPGS